MRNSLEPVLGALDDRSAPLDVFIRDDDAGWDDARLWELLDCVGWDRVPIDLAVVPRALGPRAARELRARADDAPGLLGLHQHGFAHLNHEPAGRKCEFGPSRAITAQRADLQQGRAMLAAEFEHRLQYFFTPPWNRCTPQTARLLAELGYSALSRDRGAPAQRDLPELAIDADWCKLRRISPNDAAAVAAAIAEAIRALGSGEAFGLMLHHAQMDVSDLDLLGCWLGILVRSDRVRFRSMRALLARATSGTLAVAS